MSIFRLIGRMQPWHLLFGVAGILVLCSFLNIPGTLDIHLHDTYFVIAQSYILVFLGLILVIAGVIYYLLKALLPYKILSWLHVLFTIIPVVFCLIPMQYQDVPGKPRRYYDYTAWESFKDVGNLNLLISITVIAALFAQVLFLLNFILGILFKITRRT